MTVTVIRHSASLASLLSRSISSSSFDSFLPITDSMDEDWQEFGWLLDEEAIELPCLAGKLKEHEVAKRTVVTEQNATVRVPVDPSEISLNSSKESVSITPSVLEQRDVKVKSEADIVDLPSCSAAEGRGPVPKRTKFSVKIPDMLDEKPLISLASARNTCQPVLSGTELSSPGRRKRNSRKVVYSALKWHLFINLTDFCCSVISAVGHRSMFEASFVTVFETLHCFNAYVLNRSNVLNGSAFQHAESSSEDESVTSIALSHSHNTRGRRKGVRHIAASETSASIKTDIKTETPPREIDPTQTHCICNKPYDPKKFVPYMIPGHLNSVCLCTDC
ncbi:hypothetical protein AB6A40_010010 [Gnathostoma spinigerum]|uniref:Uncharacterized protein n=1 Tax=Gnathostoma spinigerum TaxID=75299 RepID=A0ABD6ETW6_9BILA